MSLFRNEDLSKIIKLLRIQKDRAIISTCRNSFIHSSNILRALWKDRHYSGHLGYISGEKGKNPVLKELAFILARYKLLGMWEGDEFSGGKNIRAVY